MCNICLIKILMLFAKNSAAFAVKISYHKGHRVIIEEAYLAFSIQLLTLCRYGLPVASFRISYFIFHISIFAFRFSHFIPSPALSSPAVHHSSQKPYMCRVQMHSYLLLLYSEKFLFAIIVCHLYQ